jgi:uncharacterized Tic20 family protein
MPPPPPPGQQPPPGYGAPGGYAPPPPPGYPSSDDKTWALISHFGGAAAGVISGGVLGFVPPLIAYLAKGKESPTVRAHAETALNFQIMWSGIALLAWVIGACGIVIVIGPILWLASVAAVVLQVVFGIIAGLRANEGTLYQYPLSYKFVK